MVSFVALGLLSGLIFWHCSSGSRNGHALEVVAQEVPSAVDDDDDARSGDMAAYRRSSHEKSSTRQCIRDGSARRVSHEPPKHAQPCPRAKHGRIPALVQEQVPDASYPEPSRENTVPQGSLSSATLKSMAAHWQGTPTASPSASQRTQKHGQPSLCRELELEEKAVPMRPSREKHVQLQERPACCLSID